MHSVPGGLLICSHLIQVKPRSCAKVKVLIQNGSDHPITLQPQRVLADCSLVDWVKPVKFHESEIPNKTRMLTVSQNDNHNEKSVDLNFEDTAVSEQLKEHIIT